MTTLELQPVESRPVQMLPAAIDNSPAAIMMAALERGVQPADMREMLALQREWQADQARAAFHEAMSAFKAERIVVAKNKEVGYQGSKGWVGYKHAELVDVVEAVSPALARHGLSFRWDVKQAKDWITVTCILSHRLGHSERIEMGGPPDSSGNKNPLQQIASATSYLQRYTLKAITGVAEGGEDDDAGGAEAQLAQLAQEQRREQKTERAALPAYPAADFNKNLPAWRAAIAAGKKTADQVISTVSSRFTLSAEQQADIKSTAQPA